MILLLSDVLTDAVSNANAGSVTELRTQLERQREQLARCGSPLAARALTLSSQQSSSVVQALTAHPLFSLGAQPARLSSPRVVLHAAAPGAPEPRTEGDRATNNVREAVQERGHWSGSGEFRGERVRQDLSVVILLSEPADYAGGELWIDTGCGEEAYKPAAGTAIVAPAGARFRVAPVLRGTRWALELGVQSLVREEGQREILYDVGCSLELLDLLGDAFGAKRTREIESLRHVHQGLLRLWAGTL